ncbi:MAG: right-handed parallel beta-helix repeat-containing protein, partial [Sphingorhabdus sp.]
MPAIKGITAAFAQSSFFGNGQLTFTPTNPAFSIGMSNIDWNDTFQRSAIEINFSNGGSFVYSQPTQPSNSPPQFTGFKLDATSIAAGISISSLRWYGTNQSELVGIWNVRTSAPNPLVVTSTADTDTVGTLRYAINWSNSNPGADTISFDIAGTGPHPITTTSGLPTITDAGTTINGLSQTGAACGQLSDGTPHNLQIFINGNGTANNAFRITGADASISGMAVGNFQEKGLYVLNTNNALIECNYFGVEPDGSTASPLARSAITGASQFESATNSVARNNLFSGNNDDAEDYGLVIGPNTSDITIEGNIIGLNANGTAALANGATGLRINTSSQVTVGGTTAAQRNIISGNGADGILLERSNNVYLLGNYIGVASNGTNSIGNGDDGLDIDDADNITIGGTTAAARNIISGNDDEGIDVKNGSSNIVIQGNYVGTDAGGTLDLGNSGAGVQINGSAAHLVGDGSASGANIIAFSGGDGIRIIGSSTQVAILANAIFSNGVGDGGDNGIDIENDGVTANDGNDSDSGANDRLNFPEFVAVEADGNASLAYNFNLDVPANGLGYRIDFFKNSTPDSSNYGQGEIWLGSTNVSHAGGDLNFSGLLTTNSTINVGDRIAATATRITATGYDITSEFNLNGTTVQRQGLA